MNHGLDFYHLNESPYNVYRRLLIANPVYRNARNRVRKNELLKKFRHGLNVASENPFNQMPGSITLGDLNELDGLTLFCDRQCPECAKSIFHTNLFNLDWIKRCPVHGKELVQICPECNRKWPSSTELDERDCSCCGSSPPDEIYVIRRDIQRELELKFGMLQQVVDNFCQSSAYTIYTRGDRYSRASIAACHHLVGAFLRSAGELDDSLAAAVGLNHQITNIKILCFPYVSLESTAPEKSSDTFESIRFAKTLEVVSFLNSLAKTNHVLHEACTYEYDCACPYCYTFGSWYKLVFFSSVSPLLKQLGITMPQSCHYLLDKSFIQLPEEIQAIIYEKDLEMTLLAIYSGVLSFVFDKKTYRNAPAPISPNPPTPGIPPEFLDFWFHQQDDQIYLHYSDVPILTEANFACPLTEDCNCSFNEQDYISPKIAGLFNRVWLLNLERQMFSIHVGTGSALAPRIQGVIRRSKLPISEPIATNSRPR